MNNEFKIELTSQEFNQLFNDLLINFISKLNLHLPTTSTTTTASSTYTDPFKNKVALLLKDFLISTFESIIASNLLIIDGKVITSIGPILNLSNLEIIEPFDIEKNKQLRDILLNYESEIIELSKLRKDLPLKASEKYDEIVKNVDMEVSEILNEIDQEVDNEEEIEDDLPDLNYQEMNKTYKKYLDNLSRTKDNLPSLKEDFEKYNQTVAILENIYQKQQMENE